MDERYGHLGSGVYLDRVGGGPEQALIAGQKRYRFMDDIYLPTRTHLLDAEAIQAVNKWRDKRLAASPLPHRERVRRVAIAVGRTIASPRIVEIGCGSYPIAAELGASAYAGLDIDPAAVVAAASVGFRVATTPKEVIHEAAKADIAFALFAMQFAIDEETIALICAMPVRSIAFFNIPTRDIDLVRTRLLQLQSRGFNASILQLETAGPNDRLVVAGRREAAPAMAAARQAAYVQTFAEWPQLEASVSWSEAETAIAHR